jgi:hypothetical protein
MSHLDMLVNHREAILLAEAIGWLHDYRKCSDEQLRAKAANLINQQGLGRDEIKSRFSALTSTNISLVGDVCSFFQLIHRQYGASCNCLPSYLSRCHNTAHFDKQEPIGGKQNYPGVKISSPFGFEQAVPSDLTDQLWNLPWKTLENYSVSDRVNIVSSIRKLFAQVGADTRRPINEISLWDWGVLVGALYKAAIAGALLSGQIPPTRDLHWRLLSVRVNGLEYITKVARLPDLLGRQKLLNNGLDKVRQLIEEHYVLGNEVYRDENGSLFVVADLPNLLSFTDNNNEMLNALILKTFKQATLRNDSSLAIGGEVTPIIELDNTSWWGQDPDWQAKKTAGQLPQNKIPSVNKVLSQSILSAPSPEEIKPFWQNHVAETCTVCGMRPQGQTEKLSSRKTCNICEIRRLDRCRSWATQQSKKTIWIDEVADKNARLALITGQFDLDDWLSGQLVESLVLNSPDSSTAGEVKSPSFSRIRRIWETTHQFWQDVKTDFNQSLSDSRRRLLLYLDQTPSLAPFHVYEMDLGITTLSMAWYPQQSNGDGGYLISTDNLGYVARQLKKDKEIFTDPATAAISIEDYVRLEFVQTKRPIKLRNSDATASERNQNLLVGRHIIKTCHQDVAYSTEISILAEPRTFMALVPAEKSLGVIKTIHAKYEREMGKVRNRLPMHLGIVYFQRRTPLRSALDAGRQMLNYKSPDNQQLWQVYSKSQGALSTEKKDLASGTKQFDETIILELTQGDRSITWHVPIKMGDGTTFDVWYPYVFLETNGDDSKINGRQRAIKSQRPGETTPCWLVHAADLQEGDNIYFTPSTFDFEFLDTGARRFEIYYGEKGRRPRRTRPFYLEDLDRFEILWEILRNLETSQRHQVIHVIEATRETWYGQDEKSQSVDDPVFQRFVADTLANATWSKDQPWKSIPEKQQKKLIDAGVRGELADLAELHMEILKER